MLNFYQRISRVSKQPFLAISSRYFSVDLEASTIMSQLNQKLTSENEGDAIVHGPQVDIKDNLMYVSNLQENVKYLGIINVQNTIGMCISVEKSLITALILNKDGMTRFISKDDVKIPLKNLGNVIDFSGQLLIEDDSEEPSIPPE